jgi:hypothetical protein
VIIPPRHAKPLLEMWPDFFEGEAQKQCARGQVVCWARRGSQLDASGRSSPDGPWVAAGRSMGGLRIVDQNLLCRYELREERVRTRKDERTVIEIQERLVAVEIWFEPRFARVDSTPPPRSWAWWQVVGDWFVHECKPSLLKTHGGRPKRDEIIQAVQARYPEASKHEIERRLIAKHWQGKKGRRSHK